MPVSLPDFSVRRPVTIFMITLAVTLFGFISFGNLPIELLPDLAYPSLTVQTVYPDAAPISVEQFVTRPIEEAVGVTPGLREMRSVSRAGLSEVILEFEWNQSMDYAAMEVREKLGLAVLPREAERPRVLRFDPSLDPIMRLSFTGDRSLEELRQVAERWIKPRLEAVNGVAAAKVRGGLDPEIQVEADEDRLAALGLTLDDLALALRADNINQPGGTLKDWGAVYLVRTLHEFDNLDQLRRTVVRETASGRVRVEDVADVRYGHRDRDEMTFASGVETVEIALHREGSTNTVTVAADIAEELEKIRSQMAPDLSLDPLTDQSIYISAAVEQVWYSALLGGLLAILVLYFFLRDPLATLIIAVTIPISVIATFLPMFKTGVTLNIMSLGGLALGVGMLVDNSIVVLEAIDRHRRKGLSRLEAAGRGGREVAGAVTAATLTTVAVFLPIVFVRGIAGQLFYDLAVTVCFSLVASLLVSLTFIPMLSSLEFSNLRRLSTAELFTREEPWSWKPPLMLNRPTRWSPLGIPLHLCWRYLVWPIIYAVLTVLWYLLVALAWRLILRTVVFLLLWALKLLIKAVIWLVIIVWWPLSWAFNALMWPFSRLLDGLGIAYPGVLRRSLQLRWAILPLALALFVLAVSVLPLLGTNLVPDLSQGEFAFRLHLAEGATLESSGEIVKQIEDRLRREGQFSRIFSVVGSLPSSASGRQTMGENLAQINFVLPAGAGADEEAYAIERTRTLLALFPSVEAELVHPAVLSVTPPVAVNVFSDDLATLDTAAVLIAERLQHVEGLTDINSSSEPGHPEITIQIDRERAAALNISAEELGKSLRRQISGEIVGEFREQEERLDIRLRASHQSRDRANDVKALRYRLDNGNVIPISTVAQINFAHGPAAIHRAGGARVAQVTAKISNADLGHTLVTVREEIASLALPMDVVAELSGQNEELKVSFDSLKLAMALAIFMVFVVMAVQFESLKYPLVILLSVPLGIVGVVAALMITGMSVSVLALIGAVMLAGIVVNNAIILVDAIKRRRIRGQQLEQSIIDAGRERLRPILMTTTTTVLALLPMALGLGAGDELRRPMAVTVIGGLTVATLLTLIVIPCLYRAFNRTAGDSAR
jgi:HAE1 family hydrophobic/amphiphilic exporter-1